MANKKKKNEEKTNEEILYVEEQNKIAELEKFMVSGTFENLEDMVLQRKEEMIDKLNEYREIMDGRESYNPYLVSTYFFKSLNPLPNVEPDYNSENLMIVWKLYMELIEQVNLYIGILQPTLSHFCKFAGISLNTLKRYRNSSNLEMKTLVEKIFDETFDSNILLAQNEKLSNRSTELRVKVENEVEEKPQVKVNVNVNEEVDLSQISSRLKEIANFSSVKARLPLIEVSDNEDYE